MTLDQASVSRELGNMEARLDRLESDVSEIKVDMKQLLEMSTKTKMGFTILASVATAGGAVGAALPTILKAINGTAIIACLLILSACASDRHIEGTKAFEFAAIDTPAGPVGPFSGTIKEVSDERATSGPDLARIGEGIGMVGRLSGGIPGPLGAVGGLLLTAASGYLALRHRRVSAALRQTVAGIQSAKDDLPQDVVDRLHTELGMAQDEKTRDIIKGMK